MVGSFAAIAVNVAAAVMLLATAVAADHPIVRVLLVAAACGATLAAVSKAYRIRHSLPDPPTRRD
jgi:hypothetical protein